ncbi:SGNH/GDSL hydrolase family protein [Adhaeribacter soli]|uniref:SGNH hydrolase-type esterase domain-containing protein n=1 Tax=Adhaeribacter soli TaxID=2607655 RepID=A0A5N1J4B9_9BACT|nr:GDSL-type esterase/lipase family protein [Adhaeribacter soli]KAA9340925.1 hypothetical protein F0P94_05740 [Adhaeribacter soli]
MKILFIGDSLIRGSQGVNFVKQIAREHPDWQVENAGVNGETLNKIAARLKAKIAAGQVYDTIVLQGGTNDILLLEFNQKGFLFRQAYAHLRKQGHEPLAPEAFDKQLRELLEYLQAHTAAKIVLITIGCINENLQAEQNAKRRIYNNIIRKTAAAFNSPIADPTVEIDTILSQKQTRNYFLESFFHTAWFDLVGCAFGFADYLSRKRGLHLTIDGCHLNSRGAAIFKQEIEREIMAGQPRLV